MGDFDGNRPGAGSPDVGQVRGGPMFPLGIVVAVFEEDEAGGGGDYMAVPEGDIDERLRGGAHGAVRRIGEGIVSSDDCSAQGRLGA